MSRWPSDDDLDLALIEDIEFLKKRFEQFSSKGCQATLFKKPVNLEPHLTDTAPGYYNRETKNIVILKLFTSPLDDVTPESAGLFLEQLRSLNEPLSFEVIGTHSHITIQVVAQRKDVRIVKTAFSGVCDNSYLEETSDALFCRYSEINAKIKQDGKNDVKFQFNDFYLKPPYYFPINTYTREFRGDLLESVFHIFSKLQHDELGFYQVLFIPAKRWNWTTVPIDLLRAQVQREAYSTQNRWFGGDTMNFIPLPMKTPVGKPFHPALDDSRLKIHTAKFLEKTGDKKPFFAVSLKVGLFVGKGRAAGILNNLRSALLGVIPSDGMIRFLTRKDYYKAGIPEKLHYYMFFNRVSLREGILLTSKELSGFVHLPTQKSLEKGYPIEIAKGRRPVPEFLTKEGDGRVIMGESYYRGKKQLVMLPHGERVRHCHIIGKQGSGKSTLMENLILEDIKNGTGICLIEPHGDLIDKIVIPKIPPEHFERVIYFDPIESPIRINIFEIAEGENPTVIADDIISILKRIKTSGAASWGVQLEQILSLGILAILTNEEGGHLGTLKDFLVDESFRKKYLKGVTDEYVLEFWQEQFHMFRKDATLSVLRRLDPLLRSSQLREILCHNKSSINFRRIMDEGKILFVKVSSKVGSSEAYILGSLIVAKMLSAAMTREDIPEKERKQFYIYIDECHYFLCKSIQETLTGARKFGLGLVLAHQFIGQLFESDEIIAKAILTNPNIRVCFGIEDEDAVNLARRFTHYTPQDFGKLNKGEAIVKVGASDNDFEIKTTYEEPVPEAVAEKIKQELIRNTKAGYGIGTYKRDIRVIAPTEEAFITTKDFSAKPYEYTELDISKDVRMDLKLDEKKFLEFLKDTKDILSLRDVYDKLEFGGSKGNRLKDVLVDLGLITETEVHLVKGKKQSKVLALTKKGYRVLGFPSNPGKAGALHRHIQRIVAEYAEEKGYKAIIEEEYEKEKRVDVGLQKDSKKIAVEIAVTTYQDHIAKNIVSVLNSGYIKVIALFTDIHMIEPVRDLLKENLSEEKMHSVRFCLISEFKAEL